MTIFLTSSHTLGWAGDLNPANGLAAGLRAALKQPIRCVMVTSYPDNIEITDRMAWEIRECFDRADMPFDDFAVLDRRTQCEARELLADANFVILCGGHVPTENRFFHDINLRGLLADYDGVMLTISAGSMNCASAVYGPPEYDDEATDPDYQSYYDGLGLVPINILPHFQQLRWSRVGGKRLVYEIIASDSQRHPVYCLPDGSFFLITPERIELRGEAYRMAHGRLTRVCSDGQRRRLTPSGRLYPV